MLDYFGDQASIPYKSPWLMTSLIEFMRYAAIDPLAIESFHGRVAQDLFLIDQSALLAFVEDPFSVLKKLELDAPLRRVKRIEIASDGLFEETYPAKGVATRTPACRAVLARYEVGIHDLWLVRHGKLFDCQINRHMTITPIART